MSTQVNKGTLYLYSYIAFFLILFSRNTIFAQDVYLCVWRNPERTMTRIFPEAKDYVTVNLKISPSECEAIEKELGFELLPGQRDRFQYFQMTGEGGKQIGTIIAASQKGEYGAIEFVIGFDTTGTLKDIYIQRSRERDQSFKDRSFLDQFKNIRMEELKKLKNDFKDPLTKGKLAVIDGITKEVVTYKKLVVEKSK